MVKIVAYIPIKSESKRVPRKNFKLFCGHQLYKYIIINAIKSNAFDLIFVDTDSKEIKDFAIEKGIKTINRPKEMTNDDVNGNDLLYYEYQKVKEGDFLFQLFATAPLLKSTTIKSCVEYLTNNSEIDSILTTVEETGWFWFNSHPINYRPSILPRSQDAMHVLRESTGLYGITKEAFLKYKSRIGAKPKFYIISQIEGVDIDTNEQFEIAEFIGSKIQINKLIEEKNIKWRKIK